MKRVNISFKDIYDYLARQDQKTLAKKAPIHQVLLDMVIKHLPNPLEAQKTRIPKIWKGDLESDLGKSMYNCNEKGPLTYMVTKIIMDPHAGEVAVGRLFSGTMRKGQELHIIGMPHPNKTQVVSLCVGADRIPVEEITAGNIVAVTGLKDSIAGSTVSSDPAMAAFEKMVHYSEPVVTLAIEAKHTADLPKLVDVLKSLSKADPSI